MIKNRNKKIAKQIFLAIYLLAQILLLTACGNVKGSENINNDNSDVISNFESMYTGYYLTSEDGVLSITNYDPDGSDMPSYQELIVYGDGAGLETQGVVYYIYIVDADSVDSETGEGKYYMAEFADDTHELLTEDNQYFSSEVEKENIINELIEMMDFAIDSED